MTEVSLREYLIGQALAGLLANPDWNPKPETTEEGAHFKPLFDTALLIAAEMEKQIKATSKKREFKWW